MESISLNGAGSITITNSVIGDDQDETAGTIWLNPVAMPLTVFTLPTFTTPGADDLVLIMDNDIAGNGAGFAASGVNFELNEGTSRVLITGNQINSNGVVNLSDRGRPGSAQWYGNRTGYLMSSITLTLVVDCLVGYSVATSVTD